MGLDCAVRFAPGAVPGWDAIKGQLARIGEPAPLRLIDGLPAFPDEVPEGDWHELRVGFDAGMVTLRRSSAMLTCIVWSNADSALLTAQNRLAWACAAAGAGTVVNADGEATAEEFAQFCNISPL